MLYGSGRAIKSQNLFEGYDPKALAGVVFRDTVDER
jgi:hypothetical protein